MWEDVEAVRPGHGAVLLVDPKRGTYLVVGEDEDCSSLPDRYKRVAAYHAMEKYVSRAEIELDVRLFLELNDD